MARALPTSASLASIESVGRRVRRGNPVALAVLGAACISCSAILIKLSAAGAATTSFYRCVLAMPFLGALAVLERRKLGGRSLRSRLGPFCAGCFLAVDLVLWAHAIYDVGAGIATVLGNLQVIFVALIAWIALREAPGRRFVLALPVVIGGVVLIAGLTGGGAKGFDPRAGVLYGLATSLAYAFFILVMRRSAGSTPHVAGPLADATFGCAVASLLIGLAFGSLQFTPSWQALGWLLVLAVASQTVGWLLITSSLPRLPAAVSSLLLLLQPVAALVLAGMILGQVPTALQVAGALLVLAGVVATGPSRAAAAPAAEAAGVAEVAGT
jgi:drug/metabolite transporter (DMT)-like permease